MTKRTAKLKAAKVLGLEYVLFNREDVHGAYSELVDAMEAFETLNDTVEDGDLELMCSSDGTLYTSNGLPDDIEED